jgi:uncharacterized protein YjbI with pentapeptide repeats
MANDEHLEILRQGVDVWNEWRRENHTIIPDLKGVELIGAALVSINFHVTNLSGANLSKANLAMANLVHANLSDAKIDGAGLQDTDLQYAKLNRASLIGVDFGMSDLSYADLSGAKIRNGCLYDAVLIGTNLSGADLSGVEVGNTTLANNDLSSVKGLDSAIHHLPSSIGVDTIYLSKGNISEAFLRGAGLSDDFIAYAHTLRQQTIQLYSCFISHSSKDQRFCARLYGDLQANGVRTWYFPEDAKWGKPVWAEIDRGVKVYDKLVVVCSKNSLQSSPVQREIERALNREDEEKKDILFPIRIDNYIFDGWKHERKNDVLRKVVGDFAGWHRSAAKYNIAFNKLLKALRAEDTPDVMDNKHDAV